MVISKKVRLKCGADETRRCFVSSRFTIFFQEHCVCGQENYLHVEGTASVRTSCLFALALALRGLAYRQPPEEDSCLLLAFAHTQARVPCMCEYAYSDADKVKVVATSTLLLANAR